MDGPQNTIFNSDTEDERDIEDIKGDETKAEIMLRNSETRSTSQDHYIEGSKWDQPPMITSDLRK